MDEGPLNGSAPFLSWAAAGRALPGEASSGDASVVEMVPSGALLAVIDGLGHGTEAARAAAMAQEAIRRCAGQSLQMILAYTHEALMGTRGAVITLVHLDHDRSTLTWMGVGNVEGRLWRADPSVSMMRQSPPLSGGVVGHALPHLKPSFTDLSRGDIVVLTTDGVNSRFHDEFRLEGTAQQIADGILNEHWMGKDDALVLVARYLGRSTPDLKI